MIGEREEGIAEGLHAALDDRLEGYLRTDEASRALWSTDASIYLRKPVGVVVARSENDVKLALRTARELELSITPRGTGTSLAGQATAPGLALDLSELNRVVEVDVEGRRCVVEPGVIQGELNALVEPRGLVFGADTSTSDVATLAVKAVLTLRTAWPKSQGPAAMDNLTLALAETVPKLLQRVHGK